MREAGLPSLADDADSRRRWARTMRNSASRGDALIHERMFDETDFRSILPTIHIPTAILQPTGDADEVAASEWMASQIAGSELIHLPAQADFPPYLGDCQANLQAVRNDYAPGGARLVEPYLIANSVQGLDPGAYVFRDGELRLLERSDFRRQAGFLCLEQELGATAAATHFLMADLPRILDALGARGYRAAQLEAGIVAGRLYLGAYAYRFGATGLTFYDDAVAEFFSPDAAGKSCILVTAIGESPRLRRA